MRQRLVDLFAAVGEIPSLGDCRVVHVSGPIHASAHARLYLCSLPHRSEKVLAKCFYVSGSDQPDIAEAKLQYDALLHLNRAHDATAGFDLVQPYHLFAEHGIVVQSWIEGQSLADALRDRATSTRQLIELIAGAGTWLGHFHRAGSDGTAKVLGPGLWDDLVREVEQLPNPSRWLRDIVHHLRASKLADGGTTMPVASLHADFKPSNVIVTAVGVRAIDFQLASRASIYFDLAHFLDALTLDVAKSLRIDRILALAEMHRAFVEGYERVVGAIDARVVAYYLNYDLIRYMLQQRQAQSTSLVDNLKWRAMRRLLKFRLSEFRRLAGVSRVGARPRP
jgi:Ser/Thr protein kinase RdoA (MazF antagonist)